MKSILRSIKPYLLYMILTKHKTIEVAKNFPKSEEWNGIVEMYCSKDMRSFNRIPEKDRVWMSKYVGKVACRFVCDKIYDIEPHYDTQNFCNQYVCGWNAGDADDCMSFSDLGTYLDGKHGYGWHISDLKIYDKPRELREFMSLVRLEDWEKGTDDFFINGRFYKTLKRPPQSWCYVEELKDV